MFHCLTLFGLLYKYDDKLCLTFIKEKNARFIKNFATAKGFSGVGVWLGLGW
jgi:hypothetical protein